MARYVNAVQPIQTEDIKHTEKHVKFDLESMFSHIPIVYTTRLEEMTILREDLSKIKLQNIIESITSESKPRYRRTATTDNAKLYSCVVKQEYDIHATSYQENNLQNKQNFRLTFEMLQAKVEEMKNKLYNCDYEAGVVIKSETGTYINDGRNKLESLLALCKPVRVILEDINRFVSKRTDDNNVEVLSISSDSDNDIITIEENRITNTINITKNDATSTGTSVKSLAANHIVRNINDFKNILSKEDLRRSVIVIYNIYLKELDAYHIGQLYNVTEYKNRKYTKVYKFPMKKCKLVINIIVCCWRNRQSYVELLLNHKQCTDIARFISTTHPCRKRCTCCCFFLEEFNASNSATNTSQFTVQDSTLNSGQAGTSQCISKLIATAMKFKKNSKWKGYPEPICNLNYKNKRGLKHHTTSLRMDNTKGKVELYEFGSDNILYSKTVTDINNKSRWLLKTQSPCRKQLNFTFINPMDREKQIIIFRQVMNIISLHTECFLRIPMTIDVEVRKKSNQNCDRTNLYKIRHIRSFLEANSKQSKVLSIMPEIRKSSTPTGTAPQPKRSKSVAKASPMPQTSQLPIMEQQVSQTINCLIKDILHRFRNVLLTINDEGKVSAALNAPLSSLSYSELNILSQILSHAQSQVDKLGLTPGTCLNPEASLLINARKASTISIDDAKCGNSEEHTNQIFTEQSRTDTNDKSKFQSYVSTTIGSKKHEYEKSFRSYLGDTLRGNPKITNIFSLNTAHCTSSDILHNALDRSNETVEVDDNPIFSTEITDNPRGLSTLIVTEVRDDITALDNIVEAERPNKRKRKSSLKRRTKPPKIRVKPTDGMDNGISEDIPNIEPHSTGTVRSNPTGTFNT